MRPVVNWLRTQTEAEHIPLCTQIIFIKTIRKVNRNGSPSPEGLILDVVKYFGEHPHYFLNIINF